MSLGADTKGKHMKIDFLPYYLESVVRDALELGLTAEAAAAYVREHGMDHLDRQAEMVADDLQYRPLREVLGALDRARGPHRRALVELYALLAGVESVLGEAAA